MIAKIIAWGRTRDEALARLRRALRETTVVIEGGAHQQVVRARPAGPARGHRRDPPTRAGSTGVRGRGPAGGRPRTPASRWSPRHRGLRGRGSRSSARASSRPRAAAGRSVQHQVGGTSNWAARVAAYSADHRQIGARRFRVRSASARRPSVDVAGGRIASIARPADRAAAGVPDGRAPRADRYTGRGRRRQPPGHPRRGRRAPLAGARLVVATPARRRGRGRGRRDRDRARGDEDGDAGCNAPYAGRVSRDARSVNGSQVEPARRCCGWRRSRRATQVAAGRTRARSVLGLDNAADRTAACGRWRAAEPARRCSASTSPARRPQDARRYSAVREAAAADERRAGRRRAEAVASVRRHRRAVPQPAGGEEETETRVHSPREYFHTYLQTLDLERERPAGGLPGPAGQGAGPLRRHRPGPQPAAGGGRLPRLPGPGADGDRDPDRHRAAGTLAGRGPGADGDCWQRRAREVLERLVGRHPGAVPRDRRPGPQRPVPLVRPAGHGRGPRQDLEGVRAEVEALAARTRTRPGPRRSAWRRWWRSPNRSSA